MDYKGYIVERHKEHFIIYSPYAEMWTADTLQEAKLDIDEDIKTHNEK